MKNRVPTRTPEERADTARRNGDSSRRPVTAEGKQSPSQNAVRQGACTRNVVLKSESQYRHAQGLLSSAATSPLRSTRGARTRRVPLCPGHPPSKQELLVRHRRWKRTCPIFLQKRTHLHPCSAARCAVEGCQQGQVDGWCG